MDSILLNMDSILLEIVIMSASELDALSLADLVARMDDILEISRLERSGIFYNSFNEPKVTEFIDTKLISQKSLDDKRKLAYKCFGFLVQMELCTISSGIQNKILYDDKNYSRPESWHSPLFRLRHGVLRQYEILASRVAMDIFMDLIYKIDTGNNLDGKSKFKKFRNWLKNTENPFVYFILILHITYFFDREYRTAEAHGGSKLPRKLLLLEVPDIDELNETHTLSNALRSSWGSFIDILNGNKPRGVSSDQKTKDIADRWFQAYVKDYVLDGSVEKLNKEIESILSELS